LRHEHEHRIVLIFEAGDHCVGIDQYLRKAPFAAQAARSPDLATQQPADNRLRRAITDAHGPQDRLAAWRRRCDERRIAVQSHKEAVEICQTILRRDRRSTKREGAGKIMSRYERLEQPETDAEITPCVLGRTGLAEEGRQRLLEGFRHDHTPGVARQRVDQPQCRSYGRDPFSGYAAELRQTA